jgi:Bystin
VDALVDHFTRFTNDPRQMPVVWHQSLLAFLQVQHLVTPRREQQRL